MSAPTLPGPASRTRPRRPEPAAVLEPDPARVATRRRAMIGLAVVLAAFAARAFDAARTASITGDESTHLVHCLHFWMTGDDLAMWELGAPRLPHLLYSLPSYLALRQADLLPRTPDPVAIERVVLSGADRVLLPARSVAIVAGLALLAAAYWSVARWCGPVAGLVAATLLALVPEVLAHAAIAGSDVPFAAAAVLALGLLARFAERPGAGRWAAVGLAVGLAWAMRHTALLLLPLAVGAHAAIGLRRARAAGLGPLAERLFGSALAGVGLAAIAFLVLWAGDGFGVVTVADLSERATAVPVPASLGPLDISGLPLPTSALSLVKQVRHQTQGHEAYFCGAIGRHGWPTYFPVAFLLKTPVGLLALMALAAARCRPRGAWDAVALACLALLWATLVRNKVNIGVRYALLTYPLAIPFVARLFEPRMLRDRVWGPLTLVAAGWFVAASLGCHPRYLSYFNEIGGGPRLGWLYLADSNVDWGQDFDLVAPALARRGIAEVTTDISSERRLEVRGLAAVSNPSRSNQVPAVTPPNRRLYDAEGGYLPVYTRYVAVSVSRLLGLYSQNDMSWLRTRRLVERLGDSVFLFDMDRPAERPFFR
jgi:4-amino-4-deoxy-L-arabinose transferase-like glycosyltransferase